MNFRASFLLLFDTFLPFSPSFRALSRGSLQLLCSSLQFPWALLRRGRHGHGGGRMSWRGAWLRVLTWAMHGAGRGSGRGAWPGALVSIWGASRARCVDGEQGSGLSRLAGYSESVAQGGRRSFFDCSTGRTDRLIDRALAARRAASLTARRGGRHPARPVHETRTAELSAATWAQRLIGLIGLIVDREGRIIKLAGVIHTYWGKNLIAVYTRPEAALGHPRIPPPVSARFLGRLPSSPVGKF